MIISKETVKSRSIVTGHRYVEAFPSISPEISHLLAWPNDEMEIVFRLAHQIYHYHHRFGEFCKFKEVGEQTTDLNSYEMRIYDLNWSLKASNE